MAKNLERKSLREWRQARDLTVEQLAFASGVTLSTIYSAERGRHPPRHATVAKLAKALDIAQDQIIWPETYTGKKGK